MKEEDPPPPQLLCEKKRVKKMDVFQELLHIWSETKLQQSFNFVYISFWNMQLCKTGDFEEKKQLKSAWFLSIQSSLSTNDISRRSTLCMSSGVSWDIYCEGVNRLCCGFRDRDLCHINPLLCVCTHQVAAANGSKITRLSNISRW